MWPVIYSLLVLFLFWPSFRLQLVFDENKDLLVKNARGISSLKSSLYAFDELDIFLPLKKEEKLIGPIQGSIDDSKYVEKVFTIILQEANKIAHKDWYYPESNVFQTYYAFLGAALLVPYYESNLINFKQSSSDSCFSENFGNLSALRKVNLETSFVLTDWYADESGIVASCSTMNEEDKVSKLLLSEKATNIGIMQLSPFWHQRKIKDKTVLNVRKVIQYALSEVLYHKSFFKLAYSYADSDDFYCLQSSADANDTINYFALIHGSWAGIYDSGRLENSCRFEKSYRCLESIVSQDIDLPEGVSLVDFSIYQNLSGKFMSAKSTESVDFNSDCEKMSDDLNFALKLDELFFSEKSIYHRFLKPGSIEKNALFELVHNITNGTNSRQNIDKVLRKRVVFEGSTITHGTVGIVSGTNALSAFFTPGYGVIATVLPEGTRVNVLEKRKKNWAKVAIQGNQRELFWVRSEFIQKLR